MSISPEVQGKIAILRQKAVDGTLTIEEMREAVLLMRGDRKANAAAPSAKASKKQAKAEIKSADEMLDELGKI